MTQQHYEPCTACEQKGLVPHVRRMLGDQPDPSDFKTHDLCEKCGGARAILYVPPRSLAEKTPGYAADF